MIRDLDATEVQLLLGLLEKPSRLSKVYGISPRYFTSKVTKVIFNKLKNYHTRTSKYFDLDAFQLWASVLPKKKQRKVFAELASMFLEYDEITDNKFDFLHDQIKKNHKRDVLVDVAHNAVLESRANPDKGERILRDGLQQLQSQHSEESPQGNIINISQETGFADYEKRKSEDKKRHQTGVSLIDELTGGFYSGALWLWGAYTSQGKTTGLINMAYHCAMQGKNVLFVTLEETLAEVRWKLECRHSFDTVRENPVNFRRLCTAELKKDEEKAYKHTIDNWKSIDRGIFYTWQAPANTTVSLLEDKLYYLKSLFHVDVLIVDYLQLVKPPRRIGVRRDEQSEVLEDTKQLTVSYDEGHGIPILSGWQISRPGFEKAIKRGYYYMLPDFSETAMAERTTTVAMWSIFNDRMKQDKVIKVGVSKNRGGETCERGFFVKQHFECSTFGNETLDYNPKERDTDFDEEDAEDVFEGV